MKQDHQAAAGFVIRDSQGYPLLASAKDIEFDDVLVVEVMTLRKVLRQAVVHKAILIFKLRETQKSFLIV